MRKVELNKLFKIKQSLRGRSLNPASLNLAPTVSQYLTRMSVKGVATLVKTQSLPLPIDTPKLQLFTEQLLMRKARRLGEKAFYIKSYQEVTATDGQEGGDVQSGPILQVGDTEMG